MIPVAQLTHQQKIEIALQLKDTASFFVKYYDLLPEFKTQEECFNYINDIYNEIYGIEKYSSFKSFQNCMYRDAKKYRKTKN